MSSEPSDLAPPSIPEPPVADVQTPGALLQQERVRRGLSVRQAAEGLHLDPWIIEAIETNRFLALGAPVYAKGYLRKFAMLLGLAPDVIIARYEALTDTPAVPTPIPVITTTPPPRPKWPKVVGWCVVAALVIAIGWAAFDLLMPRGPSMASVEPANTAVAQSPTTAAPGVPVANSQPVTVDATPTATQAPDSVGRGGAETVTPAPAVPAQRTVSVAATGATRLRLEFSEPSWVEVYDANNQRLLYDIGQPERARTVSGQAPLTVVIGLASAVSAQVNDQRIVVPRRANRDSTRFVVDERGSVR